MLRSSAALLFAMLVLSSCEKGSAKAIRQAAMVEKTGDTAATCQAQQKIAAEFLNEEDRKSYSLYKASADSYCMNARLRAANGG